MFVSTEATRSCFGATRKPYFNEQFHLNGLRDFLARVDVVLGRLPVIPVVPSLAELHVVSTRGQYSSIVVPCLVGRPAYCVGCVWKRGV